VGSPRHFFHHGDTEGTEGHRELGPGLLESAYELCLAQELTVRGIRFERQREIQVEYKGVQIPCSYRLDFVVEQTVIVEVKAIAQLLPIHNAQLLTYLRLTRLPIGLLINFHVPAIRDGGVRRFVSPSARKLAE